MTAGMFDTRAYGKKLTAAGISERQAEVHAEVLAKASYAGSSELREATRGQVLQ